MVVWMHAAQSHGFVAVMEHPAEPVRMSDDPSSWQLPEIQRLKERHGLARGMIDQCTTGAPWQKTRSSWWRATRRGSQACGARSPEVGPADMLMQREHVTLQVKTMVNEVVVRATTPAKNY